MRKVILALIAAAITLSLCACRGGSTGGNDSQPGVTNNSTEKPAPSQTEDGASAVWSNAEEPQPAGRLFESGAFVFLDLGDGTAYAMSYKGSGPEVVIPAEAGGLSVTGIWSYALTDAAGPVNKVTLPASIKKIAYSALTKIGLIQIEVDAANPYLCSIDGALYSKDGKTLICYPADHCSFTGVRKFTLPDSVETIAAGAFWYDYTLMVVEVGNNNKAFKDVDGLVYSKDGKSVVWFPAGKPYTLYEIPDGVTIVAPNAFVCARNLGTITFPASVEKIAPNAFLDCTALKYLTVDENNKYYSSVDKKILYNKDKTELVFYPPSNSTTTFSFVDGMTKIRDYACFGCKFMYNAPVPEGVTEIGFDAFKYCDWLREVDLPVSLKTIGENAFADCRDLTVINFAGTAAEWGKVEKGRFWNAGDTPEITVRCSDGEVVLPDA